MILTEKLKKNHKKSQTNKNPQIKPKETLNAHEETHKTPKQSKAQSQNALRRMFIFIKKKKKTTKTKTTNKWQCLVKYREISMKRGTGRKYTSRNVKERSLGNSNFTRAILSHVIQGMIRIFAQGSFICNIC